MIRGKLQDMMKSKHQHSIVNRTTSDGVGFNRPIDENLAEEYGKGTDTETGYNPFATKSVCADGGYVSCATLAHELLGHGWNNDQGLHESDNHRTENGIKFEEINAINVQNKVLVEYHQMPRSLVGKPGEAKQIPVNLLNYYYTTKPKKTIIMKNKNIVLATLFIISLNVLGGLSLNAQSILGREISFRKYVRINNRRSREEVIREAVKSSAFLYLTIKDGDYQGKVMMSNDALINYYHKWMPDSLLQDNPSYGDWATNIILNEIPLDVTGFYREYHKVDSLVNWKGPKYKLLEKCIELCDKDIIDYNILATLFQWNIVLDNVDEELHLYFFPLEFRQYGREP